MPDASAELASDDAADAAGAATAERDLGSGAVPPRKLRFFGRPSFGGALVGLVFWWQSLATFAAGLGFGWLRQRSASLLAPIVAHVGTNSLTFAAAWLVVR